MTAKVQPVSSQAGKLVGYSFFCEGCEGYHMVYTEPWTKTYPGPPVPGPVWEFNGDLERPTFSPSLLVYEGKHEDTGEIHQPLCHTFVRDGQVEFLNDCGHKLAGQTRPLLDVGAEPF